MQSCSEVEAGEEGVLVESPLFFGYGGVDYTPVSTGLTWNAPTTDCIKFKITMLMGGGATPIYNVK